MDRETYDRLIAEGWTPPGQVPELLTMDDLAPILKVSKAAVVKARLRGELPEPDAQLGRTPVWLRPTVAEWIAEREARWASESPGRGARRDLRREPVVKYLHTPGLVTAYIGDGDPYANDNDPGAPPGSVILATAARYTKREGAERAGWVVSGGDDSDVIPRKADAMVTLKYEAERQMRLRVDSLAEETKR